jgi:hypothetical protein
MTFLLIRISLLLQLANEALSAAAKLTHKFRDLSKEFKPQKYKTPPELSKASSDKKTAHTNLKDVQSNPDATEVEIPVLQLLFLMEGNLTEELPDATNPGLILIVMRKCLTSCPRTLLMHLNFSRIASPLQSPRYLK